MAGTEIEQGRTGTAVRLLGASFVALLLCLGAAPALAQQATGGAGDPGTVDVDAGGNGGDAGMPGSSGSGTSAGAGGTAGTAGVPHGGNGTDGTPVSGSGGGGGGGGYSGTASGDIASPMTGGTGGNGADGDPAIGIGGGGGGGAGGDGVRISGAAGPISVSAEVAGGHGGHGGGAAGIGGGGGGGAGVVMLDAGDITVGARVSGGRGGAHIGGISGGGGGAGIILEQGGALTVVNTASVVGGDGGSDGSGGAGVLLQASGIVTVASGTVAGGTGVQLGSGGAAIAAAAGSTVVNAGAIQGGAGGGYSTGGLPRSSGGIGSGGAKGFEGGVPTQGRGGTGILGAAGGGMTVVNSGQISGGWSANVSFGQANAISLFGNGNRLELWSGSTISGNVVVAGGGANNIFALGGTTSATFDVSQIGAAAQYQGFDTFEKAGSSTWTLSGTSTEAAPWTVNGGTLIVNGSIAASTLTTVNAGGTLGGSGTVGDTFIDGGVLAPGNSIGALTVAGNLVLTAASTYLVEVDPTSADFTHVTGTATLGGATVAAHFAPGSYVEKRYTILTADGGVNGTFSGPANTNLPQNFKSALAYDGNNAFLDLALDYTPPGPPDFGNGLDTNQRNVATTLVNYFDTHGGIPLAFGALDPRGLSQASGEIATGASQAAFDAQSQFLNAMTDPFAAGQGAASSATPAMSYAGAPRDAYAALFTKAVPAAHFEQRWRVFGAAYGGAARIGGNATLGSHDATARVYGGLGGAAYALSPATQLGFALGGGGTAFGLSDGLGSGRSDLFQAGVFARHGFATGGYLTGAFAYGWHDVTTERVAPTGERLRGAYKAHVLSGRVETGWRIDTVYAGVTPYAAAQAISYRLPSYLEQGSGAADSFALGYTGRDLAATRSELGLRFDRSMAVNDALVTLRGRAAWAHNFDTGRALTATFQALPGTGFLVNGAAQARDAALVSAGAEIGWRNGLSLAASFEGEFSNTTESYAGKGRISYAW